MLVRMNTPIKCSTSLYEDGVLNRVLCGVSLNIQY